MLTENPSVNVFSSNSMDTSDINSLGGCFQYSPEIFFVSVYRLYAIVIELSRSVTTQTVFTSITKEFVIVEPRKLSVSSKDVF